MSRIDQILNYILVIRPVQLGPRCTWGIVNETATRRCIEGGVAILGQVAELYHTLNWVDKQLDYKCNIT